MGTIIVGTDFSKGSEVALRLAVDIANRWDSDIRLVWVEGKHVSKDTVALSNKELPEWVAKYQPNLKHGKIDWKIRQGKVHVELAKEANEAETIMLVIGAHGVSGYEKYYIGSNAIKSITMTKCPVLCVREGFNFDKPLERIVLPIDSTPDSRQKVPFTIEMAKIFGAKIHILGLYTSTMTDIKNITDTYVSQVEKYIKDEGVSSATEYKQAVNVTNTTLEYARSINADLVTIMSEQESTFTNLFLGSYAQQMLHKSEFPVLTLHPEDVYLVSK